MELENFIKKLLNEAVDVTFKKNINHGVEIFEVKLTRFFKNSETGLETKAVIRVGRSLPECVLNLKMHLDTGLLDQLKVPTGEDEDIILLPWGGFNEK